MKQLYDTCICPHLISNISIRDHRTTQNILQPLIKMQKKSICLIINLPSYAHTTSHMKQLEYSTYAIPTYSASASKCTFYPSPNHNKQNTTITIFIIYHHPLYMATKHATNTTKHLLPSTPKRSQEHT